MKIFVSICSFRDPILYHTLASLINEKSNHHDATYAVFEQTAYEDSLACKYPQLVERSDVIYKRIDPEYSDGVVWARFINFMNVTEDHDFIYEIDSHIIHDKHWDYKLVSEWKKAQKISGHDKVIITGACKNFVAKENELGEWEVFPEIMGEMTTDVKYAWFKDTLIPQAHGEKVKPTLEPKRGFHILAGNFFTHSDWVRNVGLLPEANFDAEEVLMSLMSYEAGYDIYHPTNCVSAHMDDTDNWVTKPYIKPVHSAERIKFLKDRGIRVWKRYINSRDEEMLKNFHDDFGVDFINQIIEERALTTELDARLTESININTEVEEDTDFELPPAEYLDSDELPSESIFELPPPEYLEEENDVT